MLKMQFLILNHTLNATKQQNKYSITRKTKYKKITTRIAFINIECIMLSLESCSL